MNQIYIFRDGEEDQLLVPLPLTTEEPPSEKNIWMTVCSVAKSPPWKAGILLRVPEEAGGSVSAASQRQAVDFPLS